MIVNSSVSGGGSNLQLVNGNMVFGGGGGGLRVSGTVYYNDENFQVAYTDEDGSTFKTVKGSLLAATTSMMGWAEADSGLELLGSSNGAYCYRVIGDFTVTFRT